MALRLASVTSKLLTPVPASTPTQTPTLTPAPIPAMFPTFEQRSLMFCGCADADIDVVRVVNVFGQRKILCNRFEYLKCVFSVPLSACGTISYAI